MNFVALLKHIWWKFWSRAGIQYYIALSACLLATWMQFQYRVSVSFIFVFFPLIGLALSLLSCVLLVNYFLKDLPQWEPLFVFAKRIEWSIGLLTRIFVYSSLLIYANGKLDTADPVYRAAEITADYEESSADLPISYSWVALKYRDNPSRTVRILLTPGEDRQLWGAEPVSVTIKNGSLGIPVVTTIEQDWDWYAREALKLAPTAAEIWKQLIFFDLRHGRIQDGAAAAQEYFKLYPRDAETAAAAGGILFERGKFKDSVQFFEYSLAQKPTYDNYQALGTALNWSGERLRAAKVLETSIPLRPDDWEAYYHLGYVYHDMAKYEEAIAWFKKALEKRPNFPEARGMIAGARQNIAYEQSFLRAKKKQ